MNQKIAKSLRRLAKEEYPYEGPKVQTRRSWRRDIVTVSKEKKKAYSKLNWRQRTAFNAS